MADTAGLGTVGHRAVDGDGRRAPCCAGILTPGSGFAARVRRPGVRPPPTGGNRSSAAPARGSPLRSIAASRHRRGRAGHTTPPRLRTPHPIIWRLLLGRPPKTEVWPFPRFGRPRRACTPTPPCLPTSFGRVNHPTCRRAAGEAWQAPVTAFAQPRTSAPRTGRGTSRIQVGRRSFAMATPGPTA